MHNNVTDQQTLERVDELINQLNTTLANARSPVLDGLPNHDNNLLAAEALRNLTRNVANGQLNCMENDPLFPYLVKTISLQRRLVLPGADTVYHSAIIDGAYRYKLSGNRGSAHLFEIEVWKGSHADLENFHYHCSLDKLSTAPGENVDIRISRDKQEGDWIELPEGKCTLLIRQYYYDWENEQPANLVIEREGAIYPPPPITMDEIASRVKDMADMIRTYPVAARHGVEQSLASDFDKMSLAPVDIGFVKLRYTHGKYHCQPDEAIILEVKPPNTIFWNFQLLNLLWEGVDYHMRQSSINGHQAQLNSDGVFRMVISHKDPGISNWLDISGRTFGLISGRYYNPDSAPIPTLKKVPFDSLTDHLPKDMALTSPEQRQEAIRQRIISTTRRQCGD